MLVLCTTPSTCIGYDRITCAASNTMHSHVSYSTVPILTSSDSSESQMMPTSAPTCQAQPFDAPNLRNLCSVVTLA